ncbi:hypothetical protein RRF57_009230 [Xylaria bambusicola]|uniref:Uncharacterized protein n=1 Tax=Xylaria bambusicola TaxID=326684 RepID=A0AAN7ZBU8_9PEZI
MIFFLSNTTVWVTNSVEDKGDIAKGPSITIRVAQNSGRFPLPTGLGKVHQVPAIHVTDSFPEAPERDAILANDSVRLTSSNNMVASKPKATASRVGTNLESTTIVLDPLSLTSPEFLDEIT